MFVIRHQTQLGQGSANRCGPAVVAMAGSAYGRPTTVQQAVDAMGHAGGLTTIAGIVRGLSAFGVQATGLRGATVAGLAEALKTRPAIALVDYRQFSDNPLHYWAAHFVLVLHVDDHSVAINDPLRWLGPTVIERVEFERAFNTPSMWARPTPEYPLGRFNFANQAIVPAQPLGRKPARPASVILDELHAAAVAIQAEAAGRGS